MPEITLESLMERVHQAALDIARHEELNSPMLLYLRPDGNVGACLLNVPDIHPSDVAKVILAVEEATMAALAMESWKVKVEATEEMRAEFEAGRVPRLEVQPRDHPERYDALVVIGEIKGQPQVQRHWRITTTPGRAERQFTEEAVPEGSPQRSRFTPLFVSPEDARDLAFSYLMELYLDRQARGARN